MDQNRGKKTSIQIRHKALTGFRVAVIAIALLLIVVGVMQKEALTVFSKAVRLCLECVGIG